MNSERVDFMAKAHWVYVASVLRAHGEGEESIGKCRHHYLTAFVHGYKHACEDFGSHEPIHPRASIDHAHAVESGQEQKGSANGAPR